MSFIIKGCVPGRVYKYLFSTSLQVK